MRLEERQGWRLGGLCECNRGFGRAWVEEEEVKELMRCLIEGPMSAELGGSQLSSPGLRWDRGNAIQEGEDVGEKYQKWEKLERESGEKEGFD